MIYGENEKKAKFDLFRTTANGEMELQKTVNKEQTSAVWGNKNLWAETPNSGKNKLFISFLTYYFVFMLTSFTNYLSEDIPLSPSYGDITKLRCLIYNLHYQISVTFTDLLIKDALYEAQIKLPQK